MANGQKPIAKTQNVERKTENGKRKTQNAERKTQNAERRAGNGAGSREPKRLTKYTGDIFTLLNC